MPEPTATQRFYLKAFEELLKADGQPGAGKRAYLLREAWLARVYTEAGRNRPRRSPAREPMERLARDLKQLASTNEGSAHCQ